MIESEIAGNLADDISVAHQKVARKTTDMRLKPNKEVSILFKLYRTMPKLLFGDWDMCRRSDFMCIRSIDEQLLIPYADEHLLQQAFSLPGSFVAILINLKLLTQR